MIARNTMQLQTCCSFNLNSQEKEDRRRIIIAIINAGLATNRQINQTVLTNDRAAAAERTIGKYDRRQQVKDTKVHF